MKDITAKFKIIASLLTLLISSSSFALKATALEEQTIDSYKAWVLQEVTTVVTDETPSGSTNRKVTLNSAAKKYLRQSLRVRFNLCLNAASQNDIENGHKACVDSLTQFQLYLTSPKAESQIGAVYIEQASPIVNAVISTVSMAGDNGVQR